MVLLHLMSLSMVIPVAHLNLCRDPATIRSYRTLLPENQGVIEKANSNLRQIRSQKALIALLWRMFIPLKTYHPNLTDAQITITLHTTVVALEVEEVEEDGPKRSIEALWLTQTA
jgi:glutathionylspermidine synthase